MEVHPTEQQAVAEMKRGNFSGLAPLVQHYQLEAVRAASLITGDRAAAEDIVQAAFLRAYKNIHQFDDRRPFGPWFLRSVVNAALRAAQQDRRMVSIDAEPETASLEDTAGARFLELLTAPEPGPEQQAEQAAFRRAVREALQRLSAEQRAAVVQRYYLNLSEQEMAEQMAVPPGTIKSRLNAARKHLRKFLST